MISIKLKPPTIYNPESPLISKIMKNANENKSKSKESEQHDFFKEPQNIYFDNFTVFKKFNIENSIIVEKVDSKTGVVIYTYQSINEAKRKNFEIDINSKNRFELLTKNNLTFTEKLKVHCKNFIFTNLNLYPILLKELENFIRLKNEIIVYSVDGGIPKVDFLKQLSEKTETEEKVILRYCNNRSFFKNNIAEYYFKRLRTADYSVVELQEIIATILIEKFFSENYEFNQTANTFVKKSGIIQSITKDDVFTATAKETKIEKIEFRVTPTTKNILAEIANRKNKTTNKYVEACFYHAMKLSAKLDIEFTEIEPINYFNEKKLPNKFSEYLNELSRKLKIPKNEVLVYLAINAYEKEVSEKAANVKKTKQTHNKLKVSKLKANYHLKKNVEMKSNEIILNLPHLKVLEENKLVEKDLSQNNISSKKELEEQIKNFWVNKSLYDKEKIERKSVRLSQDILDYLEEKFYEKIIEKTYNPLNGKIKNNFEETDLEKNTPSLDRVDVPNFSIIDTDENTEKQIKNEDLFNKKEKNKLGFSFKKVWSFIKKNW